MKKIFLIFFPILISICPAALYAGQAKITTYYSSPNAVYRDIAVDDTLTAGSFTMYGSSNSTDPDVMDIIDNGVPGYESGSYGGNLSIEGIVDIQDSLGQDLFYVDPTAGVLGQVGIGTNAPSPGSLVDVRGDIKGQIVAAHMDPSFFAYPWFEMNAQLNEADLADTSTANPYCGQADLGAVRLQGPGQFVFQYLYLDGNPLVFQTIPKGSAVANGYGQVGIRSYLNTSDINAALYVGEPDPTNTIYTTVNENGVNPPWVPTAYATAWNTIISSRKYKKDIMSFSLEDYHRILQELSEAQIVSYHYKAESPKSKAHTGFIAEDAPVDIVSRNRKGISLSNEAGFLLACLKSLKIEDQQLKDRIERLKVWEEKGG